MSVPLRSTRTLCPVARAALSVPSISGVMSLVWPLLDTTPVPGAKSSLTSVMVTVVSGPTLWNVML